jgi:hypothetical protein
MLSSRKISLAFVGVFFIGTLVGGLATWDFTGRKLTRFITNTGDPQSMAARINQKYVTDYKLTPDQQGRIAPLTQEMTQHLYEVRRQFGLDVLKTLDDYHAKIATQMTPEQSQAYEKVNQDRKQWMSKALMLDQDAPGQNPK